MSLTMHLISSPENIKAVAVGCPKLAGMYMTPIIALIESHFIVPAAVQTDASGGSEGRQPCQDILWFHKI